MQVRVIHSPSCCHIFSCRSSSGHRASSQAQVNRRAVCSPRRPGRHRRLAPRTAGIEASTAFPLVSAFSRGTDGKLPPVLGLTATALGVMRGNAEMDKSTLGAAACLDRLCGAGLVGVCSEMFGVGSRDLLVHLWRYRKRIGYFGAGVGSLEGWRHAVSGVPPGVLETLGAIGCIVLHRSVCPLWFGMSRNK